ncbi:hypothetical protein ACO0QE_002313 [Hanseniaspora vineae]
MKVLKLNLDAFSPFWFILLMATGIASSILHTFPYPAEWLKICSYVMFATACVICIALHVVLITHSIFLVRTQGLRHYATYYFCNPANSLFWGAYNMGLSTIVNYMFLLASDLFAKQIKLQTARNMIIAVYVLWWYILILSFFVGWGVTFCVWRFNSAEPHVRMGQGLQSSLLLPIISLVVSSGTSSLFGMSGVFTHHFDRNIQLLTMVITLLVWLNSIALVFLVFSVYFWNLYVNRLPPSGKIFTMFICIGPCGQGAFAIENMGENVSKYISLHYSYAEQSKNLIAQSVAAQAKVLGLVAGFLLLSMGFFFTMIAIVSIISYRNDKVYQFNKGWLAMTFPLGTMALGTRTIYDHYHQYFPVNAFRVVSAIYSVSCVLVTLYCMFQFAYMYCKICLEQAKRYSGDGDSLSVFDSLNKSHLP